MRTKTSIARGGVYLHDLSSRIIVQSITESDARLTPRAQTYGCRLGQHITGPIERASIDLTVTFSIMGRLDMIGRAELLERVAGWASMPGEITVDYRPMRRLEAVCVQIPGVGDAKKWTGNHTIIFRAYEKPYWEDRLQTIAHGSGQTAQIRAMVGGTMPTVLEAEAVNTGEAPITSVRISAEGQHIALEGIDIQPGQALTIDHLCRFLHASVEGETVLGGITPDSDDEILLDPGAHIITVEADGPCSWAISTRGRYA